MDIPNESSQDQQARLERILTKASTKFLDVLEAMVDGRKRLALRVTPDSASIDAPDGPAYLDFEFVVLDAAPAAGQQGEA